MIVGLAVAATRSQLKFGLTSLSFDLTGETGVYGPRRGGEGAPIGRRADRAALILKYSSYEVPRSTAKNVISLLDQYQ